MIEKNYTSIGSTSIKLETVKLNEFYSLTINPQIQQSNDFHYTYINMAKWLKDKLSLKDITYVFHYELAPSGRAHLHGSIKFKTYQALCTFYLNLYNLQCNYSFDTIADISDWNEYCLKQSHIIKPVCESLGLDYPITHDTSKELPIYLSQSQNVRIKKQKVKVAKTLSDYINDP